MRDCRADWNLEVCSVARVGASVVTDFESLYSPFIDSRRRIQIVTILLGTNDLAAGSGPAAIFAGLLTKVSNARTLIGARCRVVVGTVFERNDNPAFHATYRANMLSLNAMIRAAVGGTIDDVFDLAAVPELGDDGAADNPTYFSGDKIHILDAGQVKAQPAYFAAVRRQLTIAAAA